MKEERFSFEHDGINFDIHMVDVTDDVKPHGGNQVDLSNIFTFTHTCIMCGKMFKSEKELDKCPEGCEGLIRRKKNE